MFGMVQANIIFTQAAVTPGPGISMIGAAGVAVTLSNSNNAGVTSWLYEFLSVPLNSGLAVGQIGIGMTANFTPDNPATPGCYRVRLTVTGQDGTRASQIRNFAVLTTQGWLLPSFRAKADEMNFINVDEGWMEWLNRIFLSLSAGAPTDVLMSNVLFVDVNGDDGTAVRGSLTNPFATIQAALDAALDGDVVKVGPGTFTEALVWPETTLVLDGSGLFATIVSGPVGQIPISITATTQALPGLQISNLALISDTICLEFVGTGFPTSLANTAILTNVFMGNGGAVDPVMQFTCGNFMQLTDVQAEGTINLYNIARARAQNCLFDYWMSQYVSLNAPSEGRLVHALTDCTIRYNLIVDEQASVHADRDCVVDGVVGTLSEAAGNYGTIVMQGRVLTAVQIGFNFTDVAVAHEAVSFDYAQIDGAFTVASTGGTERCLAKARHATFKTLDDAAIVAGIGTDLALQGSLFRQDSLSAVGNATIDRSVWKQTVPLGTVMPHPMIFADSSGNPIPYPDLTGMGILQYPYSVIFESYVPIDYPLHPLIKDPDGTVLIFDAATDPCESELEITIVRVPEPEPSTPGQGPAV